MRAVIRIAALFWTAFAAYAANPTLLSFVPPDARIVSGIDVAKSRATPFGRYVLDRMQPEDPSLRKFIEAAGFDPNRDVSEILAVTAGTAQNPTWIAIARGVFSPSRFAEAAKTEGASSAQYRGIDIVSYKGPQVHGALAFLDGSTALVGDLDAIRAAIDRRGSAAGPAPAVASAIAEVASGNDAWFVSTGSLTDFFAGKLEDDNLGKALNGGLLASIEHASGGVQFGSDSVQVSAKLGARSEKDARALADVLRFLASLIQTDPSKATGKSPIADAMRTEVAGSVIRLSMILPETLVEQLFTSKSPASAARPRSASH